MKLVKQKKVVPSSIWDVIRLPLSLINGGFTLIEILVTVLIIGILAAIAVPQYQRAVLKSRYASLMPIAKAMADSNEAYFLEHGVYAGNAQDLPVQGRQNYPDGATLEFGTSSDYSYVLATRDNNFPNNYIVYQKHSGQFPGEIHCEANANDTQAQEVCKSFGPTADIGEILTAGYLTYVLSGTGNGAAPAPVCEGAACDEQGNITECANGQTLHNGSCEDCATAFPGAATCSTTAYKATACSTGYVLNGNTCELEPTCEGAKPADITGTQTGATGTAYCNEQSGQWAYTWTGGKTYTDSTSIVQNGVTYCDANHENECAGGIFSGAESSCIGNAASGCTGSIFSGDTARCHGWSTDGCKGAILQAGSFCSAAVAHGCDGALYAVNPEHNSNLLGSCYDYAGYCPEGVPVFYRGIYSDSGTDWNATTHAYNYTWKGNCCNPAYMVSGACPSGIAICQ